MTFTLPELPYAYDALEPYFDEETMKIHHQRHHQAYIDKANAALMGTAFADMTPKEILKDLAALPENIRPAAQNNVGGHCNHMFFWSILSSESETMSEGVVGNAIAEVFGSLDNFKETFKEAALARFGSGWVWLVVHNGNLEIVSTANQDSPLSLGMTRVLGLDVWEHAYYLKYQNKRPNFVDAFWPVVNWDKVNEYFEAGGV